MGSCRGAICFRRAICFSVWRAFWPFWRRLWSCSAIRRSGCNLVGAVVKGEHKSTSISTRSCYIVCRRRINSLQMVAFFSFLHSSNSKLSIGRSRKRRSVLQVTELQSGSSSFLFLSVILLPLQQRIPHSFRLGFSRGCPLPSGRIPLSSHLHLQRLFPRPHERGHRRQLAGFLRLARLASPFQ